MEWNELNEPNEVSVIRFARLLRSKNEQVHHLVQTNGSEVGSGSNIQLQWMKTHNLLEHSKNKNKNSFYFISFQIWLFSLLNIWSKCIFGFDNSVMIVKEIVAMTMANLMCKQNMCENT